MTKSLPFGTFWKIGHGNSALQKQKHLSMRTFYIPSFLQSQLMSLVSICVFFFSWLLMKRVMCVCDRGSPYPLPTQSMLYTLTPTPPPLVVVVLLFKSHGEWTELMLISIGYCKLSFISFAILFFFFLNCTVGQDYLNWVELYNNTSCISFCVIYIVGNVTCWVEVTYNRIRRNLLLVCTKS